MPKKETSKLADVRPDGNCPLLTENARRVKMRNNKTSKQNYQRNKTNKPTKHQEKKETNKLAVREANLRPDGNCPVLTYCQTLMG